MFCRLLGGSCRPLRYGPTMTFDHPNPCFVNSLPANPSPAYKEPEMRSAQLAGTACASTAPATRKPVTQSVRNRKHYQQIPPTQPGNRIVKSRIADDPHEPRSVDGPWENRYDEACRGATWDYVGIASNHSFWGGALRRLGLLCCSGTLCAGAPTAAHVYHEIPLHVENVSAHAWTGTDATCSPDLNKSPATTCLSIGKFSELEFGQYTNVLNTWKGTFEHNFDLQVFVENKQSTVHTSQTNFRQMIYHKFDQHHPDNFQCYSRAGAQMALAEQVRRVAQADSYALPRAWRGRTSTRGNVVPQILERPTAKARLAQPRPSRSPDLDLAQTISSEAAEAPPSPEPVEIVELLHDDPGTQEQRVHLVSFGSRWNNNPVVQVSGHLVECDLQTVDDPGRDRSLQAHLGYHPDTVSRMLGNMDFTQPLFDALFEALQHQQSTIRFTCASGRHRSVAAVHLAQAVLRGIVSSSNISIQHVSQHHWGNLCHLRCAECYNFVHRPPVPYLRAVAVIREDLLQALRGYMDRSDACMLNLRDTCCRALQTCSPCRLCTACAGTTSDPSTSPSTCAMENIKMFENIFSANFSLFQQTAQQISKSQPSKCTTIRWCSNLGCPFPDKDTKFLGTHAFTFWCKPFSYLVRSHAKWVICMQNLCLLFASELSCSPRKCELDPPSSWIQMLQSSFTWSSRRDAKCCNAMGSICPVGFTFKLCLDPLHQCVFAHNCPPPLQPRKTMLGDGRTEQDGHDHGNCGLLQGLCTGLGLFEHHFQGNILSYVGLAVQQIDAPCMRQTTEAVNVHTCADVDVLGQPVLLKAYSFDLSNDFDLWQIPFVSIGNFLGRNNIFWNQPNACYTRQSNQFTCNFQSTTFWCKFSTHHFVGQQGIQQHSISLGIWCLGRSLAMTNESLSEALRRVAKAKTSPLLPKAFVASQGGPIVPKLIAIRGPPKPFPERRPQSSEDISEEPTMAKPKLAPAMVIAKSSSRVWPPPTPPRVSRPSSAYPAASAPTPAVSPKPSIAPPVLP